MSDRSQKQTTATQLIQGQSSNLIKAADVAERVRNMELTPEGFLRTIAGPAPFVVNPVTHGAPVYDDALAIWHGRVNERSMTLAQFGETIRVYRGRQRGWETLLGAGGVYEIHIDGSLQASPPTQFINVGVAVVIIPRSSDGRAWIYDGERILPLGYSTIPAAPVGLGPRSKYQADAATDTANYLGTNNQGYVHDGTGWTWDGTTGPAGMHPDFVSGRRGTIADPLAGTVAGTLEPAEFQAAVQWVDYFGNLSPLSSRSNVITLDRQTTEYGADGAVVISTSDTRAAVLLKQVAWAGISRGPEGTVGRNLCVSKDMLHSGTTDLFIASSMQSGGFSEFATIPDNRGTVYPDNFSDGMLFRPAIDVAPVRRFRLAAVAYGRLWAASTPEAPGYLHPSMARRYGTFQREDEQDIGEEITALSDSPWGLLVFTATSVSRVVPAETGWRIQRFHSGDGTVAPNSVRYLSDLGVLLFLAARGIYAYDGQAVKRISTPLDQFFQELSSSRYPQASAVVTRRGFYRIFLAYGGQAECGRCLEFDGVNFREITGITARDCTIGPNGNVLVAGEVGSDQGIWEMDRAAAGYPITRSSQVVTSWLRVVEQFKGSPTHLYLWILESGDATLTVETFRDWNERPEETHTLTLYEAQSDSADDPPLLGAVSLGDGAYWQRWRPRWRKVPISVATSEVFKVRLTCSRDWAFLGFHFDVVNRAFGGASTAG